MFEETEDGEIDEFPSIESISSFQFSSKEKTNERRFREIKGVGNKNINFGRLEEEDFQELDYSETPFDFLPEIVQEKLREQEALKNMIQVEMKETRNYPSNINDKKIDIRNSLVKKNVLVERIMKDFTPKRRNSDSATRIKSSKKKVKFSNFLEKRNRAKPKKKRSNSFLTTSKSQRSLKTSRSTKRGYTKKRKSIIPKHNRLSSLKSKFLNSGTHSLM